MSSPCSYTTQQMQSHPDQVPKELDCTNHTRVPQQSPLAQQSLLEPASLTLNFKFSRAWLQVAAVDLLTGFPSPIVPAIRLDYIYQPPISQHPLYVPRALWNVRCLSPRERHELYIEFCVFGHTMQRYGPSTPEYKSAFGLVVEKSREIKQKEMNRYAQFTGPQQTYVERVEEFRAIVAQQVHPVDIRGTSLGSRPGDCIMTAIVVDKEDSASTTLHGQKRCVSSSFLESDHRPTKRIAREVDASLREQRAAKAEADHRLYLEQKQVIDEHYLQGDRTRKPTDPEWQKLAVFDAGRAAKQKSLSTKKPKRSTPKQARGSYAGIVACPKLPSRNLVSYPMKTAATYMCLHVDCPCRGTEDCTARTHDCCRKGLSLRELEVAVRRRQERTCARIEELAFRDGKLDRRHKTWEDWFSKTMRNQDSSRVKAHILPLGWKYDPRFSQARSSQGDIPSPQPFAVQQPQPLVQLKQRRQRSLIPKLGSFEVKESNASLPSKAPELAKDVAENEQQDLNPVENSDQECKKPEQTVVGSDVQDDDSLLLTPMEAFEDDHNGVEPNSGTAGIEDIVNFNGGLNLASTGVQLQNDIFGLFEQMSCPMRPNQARGRSWVMTYLEVC